MESIPTNTAIFSGRGFLAHLLDPGAVVDVVAGSVWGRDDLRALRTAGLVRVLPPEKAREPVDGASDRSWGAALEADDLVLRTVLWLTLAGVPVTGASLAGPLRDRLDPDLLALLDRVEPAAVADPGHRELLSLALRRRARQLTGHPPAAIQPPVAVLLPDGELPASLVADLEMQTWRTVLRCPASKEDAAETLAGAREQGALYCTRMGPGLRYGPHHVADLVEALRHSGARVAHSPLRFRRWSGDTWLEDDAAGIEGLSAGGLPDGSLWYAVDGPEFPEAPLEGYAVHGAGAVPLAPVTDGPETALRLHRGTPAVLDWLGTDVTGADADPVPRSYFAATGAPSRARSSSTASDS